MAAATTNDADFSPPNLALTSIGLGFATFMRVLDTTIANVSLPTIAGNLGMSYDEATWIVTSFMVSMAITLPLTGYFSRRFGEVRLFIWCTLLFSLTSLACGLSQDMDMLLVCRAIQGAVAGPMYPVTQSLMIATFPKAKRGMALALLGMITVVAPIAGPLLGGWITSNYNWQWIFFINVPVGIFACSVIAVQLKEMHQKLERPRMDYVGLIMLVIGVGALQLVLDRGNEADWFHSPLIVTLSIVAAIGLAIFIIWELTDDDPIVDLKLFRHRNFAAGTLVLVLAYSAFFSMGLLLPLWMQRVLHYTSFWAGLAQAPVGIFPILLTFFVGKYGPKMDMRLLAGIAFLIFGLTCMLNGSFNVGVPYGDIAGVRMLQGLGVALFMMPVLTILLSDLEGHEIASGSGLATFLRTIGASFAASIVTFQWDRHSVAHHTNLTEHINPYNPIATHTMALMHDGKQEVLSVLNHTITQQSLQMAFNDIMHVLAWVLLAMIPILWLTKPPFFPGAGGK